MVKKVPQETLAKDTKPVKSIKKEVQDAARKKLMDIKEC